MFLFLLNALFTEQCYFKCPYEYCLVFLTPMSSLVWDIAYSLSLCQGRLGKWDTETEECLLESRGALFFGLPRQVRFGWRLFWDSTLTIRYMMILEPLLWVRPALENFCGLWVGSWDIFLLQSKLFEVRPMGSAKPLKWEHSYED